MLGDQPLPINSSLNLFRIGSLMLLMPFLAISDIYGVGWGGVGMGGVQMTLVRAKGGKFPVKSHATHW